MLAQNNLNSILKTAKGFDKQCLTSFLPTEYSIGENWLKLLVEDIPEEDISEEDISEEDIFEEDISEEDIFVTFLMLLLIWIKLLLILPQKY